MSLFVDTSVWSLALRRDQPRDDPAVEILRGALLEGSIIVTAGIVLQELLQGFSGAKAQEALIDRFKALPLLVPDRDTYIGAAMLRNHCRRNGVQIGTVDALIAQLCVENDLELLTSDRDFVHASNHIPLKLKT